MKEKIIHLVEKIIEELNDEEKLSLYEEFQKIYVQVNMIKKYQEELDELEKTKEDKGDSNE